MADNVVIGYRNDFTADGDSIRDSYVNTGGQDYLADHPKGNAYTYTTWNVARTSTLKYADFAIQYPDVTMPGYMAVVGHDLGGGSGTELEFGRGSLTVNAGGDLSAEARRHVEGYLPGHHSGVAQNANWWIRLRGDDDQVSTRIAALGPIVTIPREIYTGHRPIEFRERNTIRPSRSRTGHYLGAAVERRGRRAELTIDNVARSFIREDSFRAFLEHARTKPFFVWWRPDEYPAEVEYCWLTSPLEITNRRGGLVRIRLRAGAFGG